MHFLISQSVNRMASLAFWLAISDLSPRSSALAVFTVLGLIGLAVLGVLYYRKSQLQGAVDAQFRGFREKAVALMDQIDSLRKRHKTLPSTDPDFTAPMTGATLALYNQVEHNLDDLWSRWLEVMETWNQVERQIRAGSGLTLKPTEEARKLIEQGGIDTLLRQSSACRQKLDRLNQGHEQAREALTAGRAELNALHDTPELLDRHDRAGEIARQVAWSERLFEEAERLITADPIGTQELIVRARGTSRPPSPGLENNRAPPGRYARPTRRSTTCPRASTSSDRPRPSFSAPASSARSSGAGCCSGYWASCLSSSRRSCPWPSFCSASWSSWRDSGPSGESSPPGSGSACGKGGAETRRMRRQDAAWGDAEQTGPPEAFSRKMGLRC